MWKSSYPIVVTGLDEVCKSFILSNRLLRLFFLSSETVGDTGDWNYCSLESAGALSLCDVCEVFIVSSTINGESICSTLGMGDCLTSMIRFFSEPAKLSKACYEKKLADTVGNDSSKAAAL